MRDSFRRFTKAWFALDSESILTGTPSQTEWAEQIRLTVVQEFDLVAKAFQAQVSIQTGQEQAETHIIIDSLDEKRSETLPIPSAGYFIRVWRDLCDQVRQMMAADPRFSFHQGSTGSASASGDLTIYPNES